MQCWYHTAVFIDVFHLSLVIVPLMQHSKAAVSIVFHRCGISKISRDHRGENGGNGNQNWCNYDSNSASSMWGNTVRVVLGQH